MKEDDIEVFLRIVKQKAKEWPLPFVERLAEQGADPFQILIACILSLRTRDETTAEASQRLFSIASTPHSMGKVERRIIEQAIFPVGFYRVKARQITLICKIILEQYNGAIPASLEELVRLPGVGRKTANLVLTRGYHLLGICVDVHVHRICNRWGYVQTKTPEETEQALRKKLPQHHWISLNSLLVLFGQHICTPVSPYCKTCDLNPYCPKKGVTKTR